MRGLGSGHVTCGPMRGLEINFTGRGHIHTDRQTDTPADGHRDSMTESAQCADSVKTEGGLRNDDLERGYLQGGIFYI